MAYDQSNLLSTPEGYATPKQTEAVREYAKALLFGSGQQPVRQWTQGMSNIVSALVGGADLYGAGKRERASKLYDSEKLEKEVYDQGSVTEGIPPANVDTRVAPSSPTLKFGDDPDAPKIISKGEGSILPGGERILGWDPPVPLPPPGAGAALPFDGTPANLPPGPDNAPAAIARALAAGGRGGGGMQPPFPAGGVATRAPVGPSGYPAVSPGTVPHRQPISRGSFVNTMASDYLMPEIKKNVYEQYYGQNQPLSVTVPGGTMIINPRNQKEQRFVPDVGKTTRKAGGAEEERQFITVPDGKGGLIQKLVPREEPADIVPGAPGRAAPAPDSRAPAPPSMDDTPKALQYAPDEPPGMLGTLPPLPKAGTEGKTAQLSPWQSRTIDQLNEKEIAKKQREHIDVKDFDSFDKKYTTITNAGEDAAKSQPMLELARKVIEDPKFYSGIGADLVINFNRLRAQLGSDPNAAAANELFNKITSGAILSDMRATLQGLGQVRVAEIDLLSKAMANQYNSVPANRAVLDLMLRAHKQADFLSSRATDYREGWRWDKDGKPYKTNEPPTYAGLSGTMKRFIEKMPTLSDEKIQEYHRLFDAEGYDPAKYKHNKAELDAANSGKPRPSTTLTEPPPPPGTLPGLPSTTRLPTPK